MSTTQKSIYETTLNIRFVTVADYAATFNICYPAAIRQYKADLLAIADMLGLCPSHRHRLTNCDVYVLYGAIKLKKGKRR